MLIYPALPGLTYDVGRTPVQRTRTQESVTGYEVRLSDYAYPLYHYDLIYSTLREGVSVGHTYTEQSTLEGFFNLVSGARSTFLLNDPNDNTATLTQFGIGDGSTVSFQLQRVRGGGSVPARALNSAPTIYVNGVLQTLTTDYTVNALGVVTFTSPPDDTFALTWSGTYYWPARFLDDELTFTQLVKQIWEAQSVKLRSVKI